MSDKPVYMYEATAEVIKAALEAAFDVEAISEDDYNDVASTLRGVPRNTACPGRAFHGNPAHVCDPDNS